MHDFISVVFGEQVVDDQKALEAFALLVPILEADPSDAEAADAAANVVAMMTDHSVVSSVLDWWLMVTTGHKSANGHAYSLPDEIDDGLRRAMETLRDLNVEVPAAEWVRSRSALESAFAALPDRLDLESYGAVKLQGERTAWAALVDQLHAPIERLRAGDPSVEVELDEEWFTKVMRSGGIDDNSRRWREMLKRARALCTAVTEIAELTALVRPQQHPGDLPLAGEIAEAVSTPLGPLSTRLLSPALDWSPSEALPAADVDTVAQAISDAARGTDELGRLRLADIVDSWLSHTGATVDDLSEALTALDSLRRRADALESQGVDVDDVRLLTMDYETAEAAAALDELEKDLRSHQRTAQLEQRLQSFEHMLADEHLLDDTSWTQRLEEIRGALDATDSALAQQLLDDADNESRSLLRERRLHRLREWSIELDRLDAPPGVVFELETEIRELEEDPQLLVSLARLDEVESLLDEVRSERLQLATQLLDDLSTRASEPDALPTDLRLALGTDLPGMRQELDEHPDSDTISFVLARATDLVAEADRRQMASWRADQGEAALLQHLIDYCQDRMDFTDTDIRRLYVAVKTKPFVIIAGLTGTGKSSIARLLAEAMGATVANGQFRRIAVRPDWIDQSEVLGFVNPTSHQFEPGWLADVIRSCQRQPDRLFFVLLDEMNLAPVEQYLAEILSAMEEARAGALDVRIPLYGRGSSPDNASEWPPEVRFPSNLVLIGTVNVDETTRPLSDRVIDRANVLQLSMRWSTRHHDLRAPEIQPRLVPFPEWRKVCRTTPSDEHHEFLVEVAERLQEVGIGVGLRSHLELERFLANAEGVLDEVMALDVAVLQRVIPKIRGFKRDVAPALADLRDDLQSTGCDTCVAVLDRWLSPSVPDDEFLDGTDARVGLVPVK